jgi:hypothetical protein
MHHCKAIPLNEWPCFACRVDVYCEYPGLVFIIDISGGRSGAGDDRHKAWPGRCQRCRCVAKNSVRDNKQQRPLGKCCVLSGLVGGNARFISNKAGKDMSKQGVWAMLA